MPPRLPSAEDLGLAGSLESRRGIATVDTSPIAKGAQEIGKGAQDLGGNIIDIGLRQNREATSLEEAQARADLTIAASNRRSAISEATDPTDLDKAHREGAQADLDAAAARITDPQRRALFIESARPTVNSLGLAASDKATALTRDANMAGTLQRLETLQGVAVTGQDPAAKAQAIDAGHKLIQGLADEGYITKQEAEQRWEKWRNGYATDALLSMPARQRVEALTPVQTGERTKQAYQFFTSKGWSPVAAAGIVGGLVHESGLRTTALNPGDGSDGSDSIGVAQWNSGRAAALQAFAKARGKPATDYETQLAFVDHELRTSEASAADLLNAAKTPRDAAAAFVQFERPKNYEKGATAAMGWGGRLRQAEGIHAAYGGGQLASAPGSELASFLPPGQRVAIADAAEREMEGQYRQEQVARAQDRAEINRLMPDDAASIQATGQPDPTLTTERVAAALGPTAAKAFDQGRAAAYAVHDATSDFPNLTNDQIQQRVLGAQPTQADGGANYGQRSNVYKAVREQGEAVLKQRADDPAAAVASQPAVRTAAANLQQQDSVQNREALVQARLDSQAAIGIPAYVRSPIPVDEAKQYAAQMRPLARGQAEAVDQGRLIEGIVNDIQSKYGKYSPDVLRQVLYQVTLKKDAAEVLADAIGRMTKTSSGPVVTTDGARRSEIGNSADQIAAAGGSARSPAAVALDEAGRDFQNEQPPVQPMRTFADATADLRRDPERLLPFFIQRYGEARVPADVRETMNAKAGQ